MGRWLVFCWMKDTVPYRTRLMRSSGMIALISLKNESLTFSPYFDFSEALFMILSATG